MMTYSIPNIVATIAGVAATARTLYDWAQRHKSERPVVTGTLIRNEHDCHLLRMKILRPPLHEIHIWRIRGEGLTFSTGTTDKSGRWVPGEFIECPKLDWTVTSESGTGFSHFEPSQTFSTLPIYVKLAASKDGICRISLLVSKYPNMNRRRWIRFQVIAGT